MGHAQLLRRFVWSVVGTVGVSWLLASRAHADSGARPRMREAFSESRDHVVRILPGERLGDTVGFAGETQGRYATAEFSRRARDRSSQLVAPVSLLNPVAPVEVLVADSGHVVAVDNWHHLGYGTVVAIDDAHGTLIRAYELRELFQPAAIQRFPQSVSSIHWRRGPVYIRPDQTTALITVRSGADLLFGWETGQFKDCESQDQAYRCRMANDPRAWMPNSSVPLPR
jgi:hypothetical protein